MFRDWNVIRLYLLEDTDILSYDTEVVEYHKRMMRDYGWLEGEDWRGEEKTYRGQDVALMMRDSESWKETMDYCKHHFGGQPTTNVLLNLLEHKFQDKR